MTVADLKSAGVDAIADEDVHVWESLRERFNYPDR